MKKVVLVAAFIAAGYCSKSQEIKFKDDVVLIDGKECLKFVSSDPNNIALLDMEGKEIVFLKYIHNSKFADLYNKIIFIDQKQSFTSKTYIYTRKLLVKRLVKEGLISDCRLVPEKIETFILKFDENVEQK